MHITEGKCLRCLLHNKDCVPHKSRQGFRSDLQTKSNNKRKRQRSDEVNMSVCCGISPANEADMESASSGACVDLEIEEDLNVLANMSECCGIFPASETDAKIDHDLNQDSVCQAATLIDNCQHHHHGLDLTGCYSNEESQSIGITSDFLSNTVLTTPSVGSRMFFIVTSSSNLIGIKVTNRHVLKKDGPATFIECTQLSGFKQSCAGNVCVLRVGNQNHWKLGIIQNLFPLNETPIIRIFIWIGDVSSYGIPSFATKSRQSFADIENDFKLHSFALGDIELYFVNQVRGTSIRLESICPSTTNNLDGGVQCSRYGPELFSPAVPTNFSTRDKDSFNFDDVII